MRILNDEIVNNWFDEKPKITTEQLTIVITNNCGCQIRQDKRGSSLMPCNSHYSFWSGKRDGKILHQHIH